MGITQTLELANWADYSLEVVNLYWPYGLFIVGTVAGSFVLRKVMGLVSRRRG